MMPKEGADEMSEELSNNQISLLCDIGDHARPLAHLHGARKSDLETLNPPGLRGVGAGSVGFALSAHSQGDSVSL
jgi:hypothetical protein